MAVVVEHLSVAELEERYLACEDVTSSRHYQTILLLAKGHSTSEAAEVTAFGMRWIEQLLERYNAIGPSALGDLRRGNGARATVLKPELLERLRVRLDQPPPDGGRWSSGKVARWMAQELGLEKLAPQRGWEALKALGWSIQKPRPRNPKAATQAEQEEFKTYGPPRLQELFSREPMISLLQRIRLRRRTAQPRWRYARSRPHKSLGVERRFLNQASGTPFDCQAISLSPLANIIDRSARCGVDRPIARSPRSIP